MSGFTLSKKEGDDSSTMISPPGQRLASRSLEESALLQNISSSVLENMTKMMQDVDGAAGLETSQEKPWAEVVVASLLINIVTLVGLVFVAASAVAKGFAGLLALLLNPSNKIGSFPIILYLHSLAERCLQPACFSLYQNPWPCLQLTNNPSWRRPGIAC